MTYRANCDESGSENARNPQDPVEDSRLIGNLSPATLYSCAVNGIGDGDVYAPRPGPSATIQVATLPLVTPTPTPTPELLPNVAKPGYLNITTPDSTASWESCSAALSWGAPDGAEEYQLWWSTIENEGRGQEERTEGKASQGDVITLSTTRHTLNSLYCQTDHQFKVRARGDGTGDYSDEWSGFTTTNVITGQYIPPATTTLKKPSNLQASIVNNTIKLTWGNPSSGNYKYLVKMTWGDRSGDATATQSEILPYPSSAPTAPYTNPNAHYYALTVDKSQTPSAIIGGWLRPGLTYEFQVKATNLAGDQNSAWADEKPAVTITTCRIIDACITGFDLHQDLVKSTFDGGMILKWNAASESNQSFHLYQRRATGGSTQPWYTLPDSDHDYTLSMGAVNAVIDQLATGETYDYKLVMLADGKRREADFLRVDMPVRIRTRGHQADHIIAYDYNSVEFPSSIRSTLESAITTGAHAWNNGISAFSTPPTVAFCRLSNCAGRNTDGHVATIKVVNGQAGNKQEGHTIDISLAASCGWSIACVTDLPTVLVDGRTHITNQTMKYEEPAWYYSKKNKTHTLYRWTTTWSLRGTKGTNSDGVEYTYRYLPGVVMHEFGHTAGLDDLYNHKYQNGISKYPGYLMEYVRPQTTIPRQDILYLRENHRHYEHGSTSH